MLSFFSSGRNWDFPNPSPEGECTPSHGSGGRGTFAGECLGQSQFRRGDMYIVVLFIQYKPTLLVPVSNMLMPFELTTFIVRSVSDLEFKWVSGLNPDPGRSKWDPEYRKI